MSLSVVTNISSLSAQAQLDKTNFELQQTLARLTSGLRINSAADDAAAANIAKEAPNLTKFNILNQSDLAALAQANQNTSSVLSLLR